MQYNKFGRPIPESEAEFWGMYQDEQIHFVPMRDTNHKLVDIPSYEVVTMLLRGYNIETGYPIITENKEFQCQN